MAAAERLRVFWASALLIGGLLLALKVLDNHTVQLAAPALHYSFLYFKRSWVSRQNAGTITTRASVTSAEYSELIYNPLNYRESRKDDKSQEILDNVGNVGRQISAKSPRGEEQILKWPGDKVWLADKCGNWQDDYTRLHRSILEGTTPPRYAVSVYIEKTGLADKLTGIITEFYYALLTGRAFQITHGNQPPFEAAYNAPYVNWTRPNDDLSSGPNDASWFLVNANQAVDEIFGTRDLREEPQGQANAETVFVTSNRGRTHLLFDNPFHRQQLLDWGLRPETAFACGYHYLFSLTDHISKEMKREIKALEKAKDVLKIGVMIRVGDQVFTGQDDTPIEAAAPHLACVEQIEELRLRPGQQVLWYFMSESLSLRRKVKEKYGDKVLTNTERVAVHPDCHVNGAKDCGSQAQAELDSAGLVFGAAQVHAFSLTDYQVYTRESGFGRIGAWLSAVSHWHPLAVYEIADRQPRQCSIGSSDDLRKSSLEWSGI